MGADFGGFLGSSPDFWGLFWGADLVADLQVEVAGFGVEAEVDPVPVVPDDVFGPRVLTVPPPHQLLQPAGFWGKLKGFWESRVHPIIHQSHPEKDLWGFKGVWDGFGFMGSAPKRCWCCWGIVGVF